ncbi:MAG TPA: PIN domain-containing protein [Vicinamibacterales bacterium]|jgi:predicted nucleic acid-binding protein|nr:PIN domain-containing protein [Vicinamibacterales bacterium]
MIFVDTSALYAVLDRDDENHAAAKHTWSDVLGTEAPLLVTNYILVETTALVQHRLGLEAVRVLCADILPALETHWVTDADHAHAQNALLAADRHKLSLVDCSSFHVMRGRGVRKAFAFDPHFREQGFDLLPARGDVTPPGGP